VHGEYSATSSHRYITLHIAIIFAMHVFAYHICSFLNSRCIWTEVFICFLHWKVGLCINKGGKHGFV